MALIAPPLRTYDGLASDSPERHAGGPTSSTRLSRLRRNPLVRLLGFGLALAALVIASGTLVAAVLDPSAAAALEAALLVSMTTSTVLAYLLLVVFLERRRPPLELHPRRALGLLWGLLAGVVSFTAVFGILLAIGAYRIVGTDPGYAWLIPFLSAVVNAGIAEEILLRGLLFRFLEEGVGTWAAVAVSGLVFGFLHMGNPDATVWSSLAIAVEAGVLLGLAYALTRSLWVVIGWHAAWNLTQGPVFGVPVSGGEGAGWLVTRADGPDWLTGGAFGVEASVLPVVLLVIVSGILAVLLQRHRLVVAPAWIRRSRALEPAS